MSEDSWAAIDEFLAGRLLLPDPTLDAVAAGSLAAGLPQHQVTPLQGKLLYLLARAQAAHLVLELGTLGGYSTVWLARALPEDGRLITIEVDAHHAETARGNLEQAGVADRVEVHVGPALSIMAGLKQNAVSAFDFVFIDADKGNCPAYFDRAVDLCHSGSLIVVDNIIRGGQILDESTSDESIRGVQRMLAAIQDDTRVEATALQLVGSKGHDGLLLAVVK